MLDNIKRLDLTAKEIEMIESALHTQKKILSVQSEAGGSGAGQKLGELQQLMKRIGRSRPARKNPSWFSGSFITKYLFCSQGNCSQGG
ncbi:MAG: hypothetical protein ABJ360_05825 [Roseobacter sp.]